MRIDSREPSLVRTTAPQPRRAFLLEGTRDLDAVMPAESRFTEGAGPVYPTLGRKLFPALEALEITVHQLGKHPTPEELDRSNLRRLVRTMLPLLEAHAECYPKKAYREAAGELGDLVGAVGRFKDVSVLEKTVGDLYPDGRLPPRIGKRLEKLQRREAEVFHEGYKHFRKHGLERVLDTFSRPHRLQEGSPARILAEDRRLVGQRVLELVDRASHRGLVHEDPEESHSDRKALRRVLNALGAGSDLYAWPEADVSALTRTVDAFGLAQDCHIAHQWLEQEGLRPEAARMKERFDALHGQALDQARLFAGSGALERLRETVERN